MHAYFCCVVRLVWRKAGLPIQRAILPEEVVYLTKSHIALGFIRQAFPFEPAGGNLIVADDQDIVGG